MVECKVRIHFIDVFDIFMNEHEDYHENIVYRLYTMEIKFAES